MAERPANTDSSYMTDATNKIDTSYWTDTTDTEEIADPNDFTDTEFPSQEVLTSRLLGPNTFLGRSKIEEKQNSKKTSKKTKDKKCFLAVFLLLGCVALALFLFGFFHFQTLGKCKRYQRHLMWIGTVGVTRDSSLEPGETQRQNVSPSSSQASQFTHQSRSTLVNDMKKR